MTRRKTDSKNWGGKRENSGRERSALHPTESTSAMRVPAMYKDIIKQFIKHLDEHHDYAETKNKKVELDLTSLSEVSQKVTVQVKSVSN